MYKTEVCVHKRENNKKRNYVLVNKNQCKHVPVNPSKLMNEIGILADKYMSEFTSGMDADTNFIVIGFAETATALGFIFGQKLNRAFKNVYYTHTTREHIAGEFIEFKEEHSHAVEQKLSTYLFEKLADKKYNIIFVEDEVTTGKTILNAVRTLRESGVAQNCESITIASILNGMTEEQLGKFDDNGIQYVYLDKLSEASVYTEQANNIVCNNNYYDVNDISSLCEPYNSCVYGLKPPLNFTNMGGLISKYLNRNLLDSIADLIALSVKQRKMKKVVVVGTEECMAFPIMLANFLDEVTEHTLELTCHSTTRSPIEPSDDTLLKDRVTLPSVYDNDRVTYLYNTMSDDKDADLVLFVTDGSNDSALNKLANHYLERAGAKEVMKVKLYFRHGAED